jgi:hypothetical protein
MEINFVAVLVAAVLAMALGALWYGPLFGKKWMKIICATEMDMAAQKEMQKKAMPLYLITFVLALFQVWVLARFIQGWETMGAVETALWIWAAFVVPTVAAGAMWNNDSREVAWARFLIQAGYYLALFVMFALVVGMWG